MAVRSRMDHEEESKTKTRNESEKWIQNYSSLHQILLVGDGDFSFSLCLAKAFGSASNMVATSLDQYDVVIKNYPDAKSNLESLRELGASIMHGVDATKMKQFPDLRRRRFDRIIYNFPHAGFYGKENDVRMIKRHKALVQGFFRNASQMLRPSGKVHISHKTTTPYDKWDLKYLAMKHNMALVGCVKFRKEDYPGYKNKKGSGPRCNESFRLGECSTFKFEFLHCVKKYAPGYIHTPPYQYQKTQLQVQTPPLFEPCHHTALPRVPLQTQQLPSRPQNRIQFDVGYPHVEVNMPSNFRYSGFPYAPKISDEWFRILRWVFCEH